MAILQRLIPYYREAFALPGFFAEPVLLFGHQEVRIDPVLLASYRELPLRGRYRKLRRGLKRRLEAARGRLHPDLEIPDEFRAPDLAALLRARGIQQLEVLDCFDPRATLRYDMNLPVPAAELERYGSLVDIGCIEHVFDTRQCLENCLRMLQVGGIYFLNTCVNGYFGHGLHVFNPEGLLGALELNGFEILSVRYSDLYGAPLADPSQARDSLIYLVARKRKPLDRLASPQQGLYQRAYAAPETKENRDV